MDKLRTVSETKREFYTYYKRPINSVYRRVVEELMVEMHLLTVNVEFRYNPIYATGVVTSFQRFMQGYQPEDQKQIIFEALCRALKVDPARFEQDAAAVISSASGRSSIELLNQLEPQEFVQAGDILSNTLLDISQQDRFKYSRLFAIGLYTILSTMEPELYKNTEQRNQTLEKFAQKLKLPKEKLLKDVDSYRANLDKMEQLLLVLEETAESDRKKQEQRNQEKLIAPTSSSDI